MPNVHRRPRVSEKTHGDFEDMRRMAVIRMIEYLTHSLRSLALFQRNQFPTEGSLACAPDRRKTSVQEKSQTKEGKLTRMV